MQTRIPARAAFDRRPRDHQDGPRVIIFYDDLPAGKKAVQVLNMVFRQCSEIPQPQPVVWKFDLLENPEWSSAAFEDAMHSDIVVIATSGDLTGAVQDWIERCCERINGRTAAVIALCGSRSSRFESVERAARNAKLDFFAPQIRPESIEVKNVRRGELPALGDSAGSFVGQRPLKRHWGINE